MTEETSLKNCSPTSLLNSLSKKTLPPVESWDPPFCGNIDICIHSDGHWSYNNSPFTRTSLVKLFSSVLKKEQDDYFLVTPVEKIGITVEAEPFITKSFEIVNLNNNKDSVTEQNIVFTTTLDEKIIAGPEHPIKVSEDHQGQPYPTIHLRNNLHALICRSDFYQLIEQATSVTDDKNKGMKAIIKSQGVEFVLGYY